MAYSIVSIGNMALSKLGSESTIETIDESNSPAQQIKLWYDHSRIETLKAFNWNFARRRTALALHDEAPPAQWLFRYQVPGDCIAAREIENVNKGDAIPFDIESSTDGLTDTLLTNWQDPVLVYTRDVANPERFPSNFVTALAYRLAAEIAYNITGKRTMMGDMIQLFNGSLTNSMKIDASQGQEDKPREASWIEARY